VALAVKIVVAVLVGLAPAVGLAFDVNGAALGGREADVKKAYPSAFCKPLDWKSTAADRRCDDARISFGGVPARVTFYLKADAIQAFDLRFDSTERDKVTAQLKSRWGAPLSETTETFGRRERNDRKIYKARWAKGKDQALLTVPLDRKRATLSASRGNFDEEIYRVR
jgi:hypothetical protein